MEFIQKVFVQEAKEKNKEREGKTQTKTSLNQSNQKSKETLNLLTAAVGEHLPKLAA